MTATHLTFPCRLCGKSILPSTAGKTEGLCLDCHLEDSRRRGREAREASPGCAACDGSTTGVVCSFDWEPALAGKGEYRKYPRYLERERGVKHGERYHCKHCGAVWYLHQRERGRQMTLIAAAYVPVFTLWSMRPTICPDHILQDARRIGADPPDTDGNKAPEVWIPCSVSTRQGERIDLAALCFSDQPPIPRSYDSPHKLNRYRLIDDVADIAPSRFALSRTVRFQASRAVHPDYGEISISVKAKSGKTYAINHALFFDHDGIAGEELRLASSNRDAISLNDPHGPIAVFVADWVDAADVLRMAGNPVAALGSWLNWVFRERRR